MAMVDPRRVQKLNDSAVGAGPVVYVMAREERVNDSWPLLYAQQQALARNVPLLVLFVVAPMFLKGSSRHNDWMIASLKEVEIGLAKYNIPFFVRTGQWAETVCAFVAEEKVGEVVFDFNPLQPVRSWREDAAKKIAVETSVVDGRNIVPCFVASQKAEFAAYTFRPRVTKQLPEFLTAVPKLKVMASTVSAPNIDWPTVAAYRQCEPVPLSPHFVPGEAAGASMLRSFIENRLEGYASRRNDPNAEGVSHLSPYLRWGNLSAQRVALAVREAEAPKADKEAFLEELIVRRELADNYVYYTNAYATVAGAHAWAQKTIAEHAHDTREYVYTYAQFRDGKTHDPLWNAMQHQLLLEGKMHGWCRMYWAKKILEWTPDAQTAIDVALQLNDTYELDGRDSNGVAGVMWSVAGVHDRAWNERPVFGKIRYMNFAGAKRKFDVAGYIAKYEGNNTLFT